MPPRHGKSELISKWVLIWFLSHFPQKNIILVSHEADFAASWGRKVRNEIESNPLIKVQLRQDSKAADRFQTLQGGGMATSGVLGPIVGKSADLLVIDDYLKNPQEANSETRRQNIIEWFNTVAYTRCEPGASIILLNTRWHEEDLTGYLEKTQAESWKVIRLPALAEDNDPLGRKVGEALCAERFTAEDLKKKKAVIGSRDFDALYQQRPNSEAGNVFKREWFQSAQTIPEHFDEVIQSWDMAFRATQTSDFVVGQTWGRKGSSYYLLDQVRGRLDFSATLDAVRRMFEKWPNTSAILCEAKANGDAVVNFLKKELPAVIAVDPEGGKLSRANSIVPLFEARNIYLPNPVLNQWVEDYMNELANFPNGKHDDMVDATSQALIRLRSYSKVDLSIDFSFNNNLVRPSVWFR